MEFYVQCHAYLLTLLTHIATSYFGLHLGIALMAKRTILIAYEATVSQLFGAQLTTKALRMPASGHGLDNTSNDELSALVAAGGKQYMEVPFAILAALELVENAILERTEALSATESRDNQLVAPYRGCTVPILTQSTVCAKARHWN